MTQKPSSVKGQKFWYRPSLSGSLFKALIQLIPSGVWKNSFKRASPVLYMAGKKRGALIVENFAEEVLALSASIPMVHLFKKRLIEIDNVCVGSYLSIVYIFLQGVLPAIASIESTKGHESIESFSRCSVNIPSPPLT